MLKTVWKGWLVFAEKLGTVQMIILLTLLYLILVVFMAIPFKFFADPLHLRDRWRLRSGWQAHPGIDDPPTFLTLQ
jgi:hypothetical protein